MMRSGRRAIEAVERLQKSENEFTKTLLDIVRPVNMNDLPNPYDAYALSEDLKPCPFCGSTTLELGNLVDEDDYFVSCEDCGVQQLANHTKPEAARLWNMRLGA